MFYYKRNPLAVAVGMVELSDSIAPFFAVMVGGYFL